MRNRKKILVSVGGFFVLVFLVAICFNVSKFFNFQIKTLQTVKKQQFLCIHID